MTTITPAQGTPAEGTPVERQTPTWSSLVRLAVAGDLLLLLAQGVARQDLEALAVAAVMLLAAGLLRLRGGLAGLLLACLSFANLEVWMLPAAVSNAGHRAAPVSILLPAALAAISLAGLVAGVGAIASRRNPAAGGGAVTRAGLAAVAAVVVVVAAAATVGQGPTRTARSSTELAMDFAGAAFRPATLTAPGGPVTIEIVNRDLFWHSFTIDRPAVNVDVPVGGTRRATFTLPPGTYQFYCRVPGHKQAGMVGTLTVG